MEENFQSTTAVPCGAYVCFRSISPEPARNHRFYLASVGYVRVKEEAYAHGDPPECLFSENGTPRHPDVISHPIKRGAIPQEALSFVHYVQEEQPGGSLPVFPPYFGVSNTDTSRGRFKPPMGKFAHCGAGRGVLFFRRVRRGKAHVHDTT